MATKKGYCKRQFILVVKTNEDLLKAARQIFGYKTVVNAWFAATSGTHLAAKAEVEGICESFKPVETADISIPTASAVVIEFSNGRHVMFSTTEWANIELVEDEIVEVS